MKNILVAFGDSYGAGAELFDDNWNNGEKQKSYDDKNFVQLLGKDYDAVLNYSTSGASIPSYIDQLKQFQTDYNYDDHFTVLVMITQHNRDYIYTKERGWINIFPNVSMFDKNLKPIEEKWYRTVEYPETGIHNWYTTISLLQNFFYQRQANVKDFYIEQFKLSPSNTQLDFLVNYNKIYQSPLISELFFPDQGSSHTSTMDWRKFITTDNYKEYFATGFHPNEEGHKIISKRIKELL